MNCMIPFGGGGIIGSLKIALMYSYVTGLGLIMANLINTAGNLLKGCVRELVSNHLVTMH